MADWTLATPENLAGPHRHQCVVSARTAAGTVIPLATDVDSGPTITFDEHAAPYVQVTCPVLTPDRATLDALNPSGFTHLLISTGYVFPSGQSQLEQFVALPITGLNTDRPANQTTITAESVERLQMDYHYLSWTGRPPYTSYNAGDTMANLYRWLVQWPLFHSPHTVPMELPAWMETQLSDPVAYGYDIAPGDSAWKVIDELGGRLGWKLFGNELGAWAVRPVPRADETSPRLSVRTGVNLEASSSEQSTAEWANALTDVYEWDELTATGETTPKVLRATASVTSGPYSTRSVPTRSRVRKFDKRIDQATADGIAARTVRRMASRTTAVTVTTVAHYDIRPRHVVTVQLPTWPSPVDLVVSRAVFTPTSGTMRLTLRNHLDETATTITTGE